jgi:hypothetical protein
MVIHEIMYRTAFPRNEDVAWDTQAAGPANFILE